MTKEEFADKYLALCEESGLYVTNFGYEIEESVIEAFEENRVYTFQQHKEDILLSAE